MTSASRTRSVRIPVLHQRGISATIARLMVNVAAFIVLASAAIALEVWFSRLVENAHLHHDSGVALVLQGMVGVGFISLVAVLPLLAAMEWLTRRVPYPRVVVFVSAVGIAALGVPWLDDFTGSGHAIRFLLLGVAALYGLTVVLPDGRSEADTLSLQRVMIGLSLAVLSVAGYALASYSDAAVVSAPSSSGPCGDRCRDAAETSRLR